MFLACTKKETEEKQPAAKHYNIELPFGMNVDGLGATTGWPLMRERVADSAKNQNIDTIFLVSQMNFQLIGSASMQSMAGKLEEMIAAGAPKVVQGKDTINPHSSVTDAVLAKKYTDAGFVWMPGYISSTER